MLVLCTRVCVRICVYVHVLKRERNTCYWCSQISHSRQPHYICMLINIYWTFSCYKLLVSQLMKKFPAFYEAWKCITLFAIAFQVWGHLYHLVKCWFFVRMRVACWGPIQPQAVGYPQLVVCDCAISFFTYSLRMCHSAVTKNQLNRASKLHDV